MLRTTTRKVRGSGPGRISDLLMHDSGTGRTSDLWMMDSKPENGDSPTSPDLFGGSVSILLQIIPVHHLSLPKKRINIAGNTRKDTTSPQSSKQ